MDRIVITPQYVDSATEYLNRVKNLASSPIDKLKEFHKNYKLHPKQKAIIDMLVNDFDKILTGTPKELEAKINQIKDSEVFASRLEQKLKSGTKLRKMTLGEKLVSLLYSAEVQQILVDVYSRLPIRTCVYCNAQFAISTKKNGGIRKRTYQFDHIIPKRKYPILAGSFFNLVPCCSSCNLHKKEILLYNPFILDSKDVSPYVFNISSRKMIESYIYFGSQAKLGLKLIPRESSKSTELSNFEKSLYISEFYANNHEREVFDLLRRKYAYNNAYLSMFEQWFVSVSQNINSDELVYGRRIYSDSIFEDPLTKLIQDMYHLIEDNG